MRLAIQEPISNRRPGGAAALAALLIAGLTVSYFGNRALVANASGSVEDVAETYGLSLTGQGDVMSILAALDALRTLPGVERADGAPPLHLTLGLYQGDKLGQAGQATYRRALNQLLVPLLMRRLEQQVAENATNAEVAQQALKAYLMFTAPERRDPDFMKLWIGIDWNTRHPGAENAAFRDRFAGHLAALFENPIEPTPEQNVDFVARTRQMLLRLPPGARVYSELKGEAVQPLFAQWRLAEHVRAKDLAFFRRRSGKPMTDGVPAFYTVEGYRKHFVEERTPLIEAAGRDTWVLGPEFARFQMDETGAQIVRKAEELYLSDYIRAWDALLTDLELVVPANVEELAEMLRAVSQPNSPVKIVLEAISEQTQLAAALRKQEQERQLPAGQLEQLPGRLKSDIGQASDPDVDPAERVDEHFRPLIELVQGKDGRPPPIDAVLQPLGELHSFILQTRRAGADPRQAPDDFSTEFPMGTALAAQLQAQARAQPEPVKRWLRQLANAVSAL